MVFGQKKKVLPPYQPSSQPQPQEPGIQEQQNKTKYFTIKAKSILENKISMDDLAEPYVIIEARREDMGEIGYVINILARLKGYKVVSFSTTRFFAYVIVEKQ